MARATITRKIQVAAAPAPGDLPSSGTALLVAESGGHQAIRPGTHGAANWTKALFEAYGSGAFNPDYSTDGAFVIAGSGGHNHPEIRGAAAFDFTARQWVYTAPAGVTETSTYTNGVDDTNGSPWYELTGTEVPAPPHPYRMLSYIPSANGGGAKGSMIYVGRTAVGATGLLGSSSAHKFNCATGAWARAAATTGGFTARVEGTTVFDPTTNRYYAVPSAMHDGTSLRYLDAADWTWNSTPTYSYATPGSGTYSCSMLYEGGGKRLIINFWGSRMHALDLDDIASGWQALTYSGALPSSTGSVSNFVHHGASDIIYARNSSSAGQVLLRITPPSNRMSGTWVVDTVTLTGDTIPEYIGTNATTNAYQSLFYIPAYQMLGWVTAFGVAILNP